jgi:hypothetical protein
MSEQIKVSTLHNATTDTTTGAFESTNHVALNPDFGTTGYFSVLVSMTSTGASVLKVQPMVSFDGTTFKIPQDKDGSSVNDVVTAHAVATGDMVYSMSVPVAPFVKTYLTLSGSKASTINIKLAHQ